MAEYTTEDVPPTGDELDPEHIANAFVDQYYLLMEKSPALVHKFYNDKSIIDHPEPNGEMTSAETMQGINDKIMSSNYKGCSFEIMNVYGQRSLMGGVMVAVNGYFLGEDNLKKSFFQTFFLAQQERGYFVLNDILHIMEITESEALPSSKSTEENASDVPLSHDEHLPEETHGIPTQPKEVIDNGEKESNLDSGEKASDVDQGEKESGLDRGEKTSDLDLGEKASDLDLGEKPLGGEKASDLDSGEKALGDEKESDGETSKSLPDVKATKTLSDDLTVKEASHEENSTKASEVDGEKKASDVDSGKKEVSDIKDKVAEVPKSSNNESENESALTNVASNEKPKFSYASMLAKESRVPSHTEKTGYKIVRVAANADQQPIISKTPRNPFSYANIAKKEFSSSNAAAKYYSPPADSVDAKSIYIANLPRNITKQGLIDALKIFGRVRPESIQIRSYEDGFCFGFVEFESASAASKAVEVHNVTVGGHEAYMLYKRSGSRPGYNVGSRIGNNKGNENADTRGNSSHQDDNRADLKVQPGESGGQSRVIKAYPQGKQTSEEKLPAGEAPRKNTENKNN